MVIAARTVSQVATHMGVAFGIMYFLTGSVAFGGLAALLEPVINVMLLPLHQRAWARIRANALSPDKRRTLCAAEKITQVGLHMGVAFAVMFWATGSVAFGGLAAVLEPVCNVILLPFHDEMWKKIGVHLHAGREMPAAAA